MKKLFFTFLAFVSFLAFLADQAWADSPALTEAQQQEVRGLMIQANSLYGQGKIFEAVETWKKAQMLDPTNPIISEKIMSAQRQIEMSKAKEVKETAMPATPKGRWKMKPGLYAVFETTKGRIVCELFEKEAPKTVQNFVELARGDKEWTDMKSGETVKQPFYNGLIFHRVIPKFMIQGGCPLGTGTGRPGYIFEDEFDQSVKYGIKHDRPGRLSMANSGPHTNGSQFFITTVPTPHLDPHEGWFVKTPQGYRPVPPGQGEKMMTGHAIFGQVVEGQEVAETISRVPTDAQSKPQEPVLMKSVTIERIKDSRETPAPAKKVPTKD